MDMTSVIGAGPRPGDDHTVLGRALAILDVVSVAAHPVSLAELSARTGIPKPTTLRIARDLVTRRMLERVPAGYVVGPKFAVQGARVAGRRHGGLLVQPHLHELVRAVGASVAWFASFDGGEISLGAVAFAARSAVVDPGRWPTAATAGTSMILTLPGRFFVADRTDVIDGVLRGGVAPFTPHSTTETRRLTELILRAGEERFAVEYEQVRLGFSCAGAPIPDAGGRTAGVIGVTYTGRVGDGGALARAVRRTADAVTADLAPQAGLPLRGGERSAPPPRSAARDGTRAAAHRPPTARSG